MPADLRDRLAGKAAQAARAQMRPWPLRPDGVRGPYPHQVPPAEWGPAQWWLMDGGRDAGKTLAGARYTTEHVLGPPCFDGDEPHRLLLVAPTQDDAREAQVYGPSGLLAQYPPAQYAAGKVRWPNGSTAVVASGHSQRDVDRLRAQGGNRCWAWVDEGAAIPRLAEVLEQLDHALRAGVAMGLMSTTPRRRLVFRQFQSRPEVHITRGSTFDNAARAETEAGRERHRRLRERYAHSAAGAQELYGRMDKGADGALWDDEWIARNRLWGLPAAPWTLGPVAQAIDAAGEHGTGDATGLVVAVTLDSCPCGNGAPLPHFGALEDATKRSPRAVAMRHALDVGAHWHVGAYVVEANGVGGPAMELLQSFDPDVPLTAVTATQGKALRADPVADLYRGNRVHHIGPPDAWVELEWELTNWVPPEIDDTSDDTDSPNRLDALVYVIRHLAGLEVGSDGGWWL